MSDEEKELETIRKWPSHTRHDDVMTQPEEADMSDEIDRAMAQARTIKSSKVNATKIIIFAEDEAWKMADEIERLRTLVAPPLPDVAGMVKRAGWEMDRLHAEFRHDDAKLIAELVAALGTKLISAAPLPGAVAGLVKRLRFFADNRHNNGPEKYREAMPDGETAQTYLWGVLYEAATMLEALARQVQSHKEWLKSRDEQIQRNYVKALDDGDAIACLSRQVQEARNAALEEAANRIEIGLYNDYKDVTSRDQIMADQIRNLKTSGTNLVYDKDARTIRALKTAKPEPQVTLAEALLPCPFCGTYAEVVHTSHIRCGNIYNCDAETRLGERAWNRRAAAITMLEAIAQQVQEAEKRGMERAARAAEEWEPVIKLLPLCSEAENECAMTGQWEARERIIDAIRALKDTPHGT